MASATYYLLMLRVQIRFPSVSHALLQIRYASELPIKLIKFKKFYTKTRMVKENGESFEQMENRLKALSLVMLRATN